MSHPDIQKAREWAEIVGEIEGLHPEPRAAVEVILTLRDRWIDADKVRELADQLAEEAEDFASEGLAHRYMTIAKRLLDILPAPSLPTLADMTPEEREACRWMQADVKLANGGSATCVIANPRMPGARVRVWAPHGGSDDVEEGRVTPLPGEPKLEWPGGDVEDTPVVDDEPIMMPRPEDVPAREPWIVRYDGKEWIGVRANEDGLPWSLISMDGLTFRDVSDHFVTLVSRLVRETP